MKKQIESNKKSSKRAGQILAEVKTNELTSVSGGACTHCGLGRTIDIVVGI